MTPPGLYTPGGIGGTPYTPGVELPKAVVDIGGGLTPIAPVNPGGVIPGGANWQPPLVQLPPIVPKILGGAFLGGTSLFTLLLIMRKGKLKKNDWLLIMLGGGLGGAAAGVGSLGGSLGTMTPVGDNDGWIQTSINTFGNAVTSNPLASNPLAWFKSLGGPSWSPLS